MNTWATFSDSFGFDGGTGVWFYKDRENVVGMSFGFGGVNAVLALRKAS